MVLMSHISVLLQETLDLLLPHGPVHRVIDGTLGAGGHTKALLDAGVTGLVALCLLLAAPVVIAAMADRDETWRTRMAAGIILTVGFVASGMTNILFEHDLMDSAFIVLLVLIAASVPAGDGRRAQTRLSEVDPGDGDA